MLLNKFNEKRLLDSNALISCVFTSSDDFVDSTITWFPRKMSLTLWLLLKARARTLQLYGLVYSLGISLSARWDMWAYDGTASSLWLRSAWLITSSVTSHRPMEPSLDPKKLKACIDYFLEYSIFLLKPYKKGSHSHRTWTCSSSHSYKLTPVPNSPDTAMLSLIHAIEKIQSLWPSWKTNGSYVKAKQAGVLSPELLKRTCDTNKICVMVIKSHYFTALWLRVCNQGIHTRNNISVSPTIITGAPPAEKVRNQKKRNIMSQICPGTESTRGTITPPPGSCKPRGNTKHCKLSSPSAG